MRKDEKILCICCPHCGAINQKSVVTRSIIICDNCSRPFWAMASDGFVLTCELENKSKVAPSLESMLNYHKELTRLISERQ